MKNISIIFSLFLFSCVQDTSLEDEKEKICDCKELQYDHSYNVLHLGDRLKPFTGRCYEYYRRGKLKKDLLLIEGKYHGELFYYYESGQVWSIVDYREGLLFGNKKVYDETGQLLFHGVYKRNRLMETVFNITH
jgi:antitoxin component YwqK of YwqJK toxin-antitoxin module